MESHAGRMQNPPSGSRKHLLAAKLAGLANEMRLVPEVSHARENHGQPQPVGSLDDFLVAH